MIFLLLFLLFLGLIISYILTNRNILSALVLAHAMYISSTLILVFNIKDLDCDISPITIVVIIGSLFFLGCGELLVSNAFNSRFKVSSPAISYLPNIDISISKYRLSIIGIVVMSAYSFYRFNYIGSYLGGSDFISKYMLKRLFDVSTSNLENADQIYVSTQSSK